MLVTPGPFAPTVTQHVAGTPAEDVYGNEVPAFTDRSVRVLAEYPGNAFEADNAAGDVITADRVLLVTPSTTVTEFDEFTISDGLRYRVNGAPAPYINPFTGTAVTQINLRRIA